MTFKCIPQKLLIILFFAMLGMKAYAQPNTFQSLYPKGIEAYNAKNYDEAFDFFSEAQFCKDKPKKTDLKEWLIKTNKLSAEQTIKEHWQANYFYVYPIMGDRAYVYKDGKYGFVNNKGEVIVPLIYNEVTLLDYRYLKVVNEGKTGILSLKGVSILPIEFSAIDLIYDDVFLVKANGKQRLFNQKLERFITTEYESIYYKDENRFAAYETKEDETKDISILIDREGKQYGKHSGLVLDSFSGAYSLVYDNPHKYILDTVGNEVPIADEKQVETIGNGYYRIDGKIYQIKGKKMQVIKADKLEPLSTGFYLASKNGLKGVIAWDGTSVIPIKYSSVSELQYNEIFIVRDRNQYGLFYKNGKMLLKPDYDMIDTYSEEMAVIRKNGLNGFVNTLGKIQVPLLYNQVTAFSEGLAVVKQKNRYGFIDKNNTIVIPLVYSLAESFDGGKAKVKEGRTEYFIDKNNQKYSLPQTVEVSEGSKYIAKLTEKQNRYDAIMEVPSSRFMYDTLFSVGANLLSYYQLLNMNIDRLAEMTTQDEFLYWINFVALNEHNYLRFCDYEKNRGNINTYHFKYKVFLTVDECLVKSAWLHSSDCDSLKYIAHLSKDGRTFDERITAQNYSWNSCGENIAWNQGSIAEVMCGWYNSPGHYANIIQSSFENLGFGCKNRYWTVNFGRRMVDNTKPVDDHVKTDEEILDEILKKKENTRELLEFIKRYDE